MSKVQVKDLIRGFEDEFVIGGNGAYVYENLYNEKLKEISDIEIVPRKIVEKIIAYCEEEKKIYSSEDEYDKGASAMATNVIEYATDILKLFEGEDK